MIDPTIAKVAAIVWTQRDGSEKWQAWTRDTRHLVGLPAREDEIDLPGEMYVQCNCSEIFQVSNPTAVDGVNHRATLLVAYAHYRTCDVAKEDGMLEAMRRTLEGLGEEV